MNSTLDKQSEISESAMVTFQESQAAESQTLFGFNAKQSARILARLATQRAQAESARMQAQGWQTLATIGGEIADKLATLRARYALLDRI